jgi:hypothetical protein
VDKGTVSAVTKVGDKLKKNEEKKKDKRNLYLANEGG